MDNGLKISTIIGAALIALPVGAVPLSSQTTTFSGTIPVICDYNGGSTSVTMTRSGLNQLEGLTSSFWYDANAAIKLSLSPITIAAAPSGTTSYSWLAKLLDANGNAIAETTPTSSQNDDAFFNDGLASVQTFNLRMQVEPSSGTMKPGTYTGSVTLDCIVQ